jgi:hypothetical protein
VQGKQARAVEVLSFAQFTRTKVQIIQILTPEELLEALLQLGANPNIRTGLSGCPRGAQPGMGWTPLFRAGTQFTCFTSTPVQILTAEGCHFSEVCIAAVEARRRSRATCMLAHADVC